MTITQIYTKYKIPHNLQRHMLRVAFVGKTICEINGFDQIKDSVVKALLLHDMGNIIKFKLGLFPESLQPEGLEYWQNVQNQFIQKYGKDEHNATKQILKELEINDEISILAESVGFSKSKKALDELNYGKMICCYSDQRVSPYGIVTLSERLKEGEKRFVINKNIEEKDEQFIKIQNESRNALREIEKILFENSSINPDEIVEDEEEIENLKETVF